jgi:hypothetical protein
LVSCALVVQDGGAINVALAWWKLESGAAVRSSDVARA